jgi:hypothetical protein
VNQLNAQNRNHNLQKQNKHQQQRTGLNSSRIFGCRSFATMRKMTAMGGACKNEGVRTRAKQIKTKKK